MKELVIKLLGTISVFVDFICKYLDGITAKEFVANTLKFTAFGLAAICVAIALYAWTVILCCI